MWAFTNAYHSMLSFKEEVTLNRLMQLNLSLFCALRTLQAKLFDFKRLFWHQDHCMSELPKKGSPPEINVWFQRKSTLPNQQMSWYDKVVIVTEHTFKDLKHKHKLYQFLSCNVLDAGSAGCYSCKIQCCADSGLMISEVNVPAIWLPWLVHRLLC